MTTPKTGAPELAESQADKEESVNEGLRRIEAGASLYPVIDKDLSSPPGSCADGDCYIVAATGSGAWVGRTGEIAIAVGTNAANGWYFRFAEEGVFAWVQDENLLYYHSVGSSPGTWTAYTASAGSIALDNLSDVDASTPSNGQVLTYDTNSPTGWKAITPAAGVTTLDGLSDVDVSSSPTPTDGQALVYNAGLGLWVPGSRVRRIDDLLDVDTTSSPVPANGDVLTYNSALGQWVPGTSRRPWSQQVAIFDEATAVAAGTAKATFRTEAAVIVEEARASLTTAQTAGGQVTVDINEGGVSILSTKLIIDNGARTSVGSSPAAVLSDTALADNAEITVDVDNIGDGTAKGLKIMLIGRYA